MFCLNVCNCTTYVQGQERPGEGVGSPRAEVNRVVSLHVDTGNQTYILWQSYYYSKAWNHPYSCLKIFFILMQKTADVVDFRNGSGNNKGEFI